VATAAEDRLSFRRNLLTSFDIAPAVRARPEVSFRPPAGLHLAHRGGEVVQESNQHAKRGNRHAKRGNYHPQNLKPVGVPPEEVLCLDASPEPR
jgi:hypothetical protein